MSTERKRILLKVSGSIAAFKAAALASKLVQNGFEVRTVLTKGAQDFIGKGSFEGLTGERVWTDLFEDGTRMDHIHLARWADLQLVYPASADTIAKLRSGRAEDLLSTLFLAKEPEQPYWIAPAMNVEMYRHPAVQENLAALKAWGVRLLDPDSGRMACGEVGSGRVQEPEAVLHEIQEFFANGNISSPLAGKSVLITAGGTFEPIDPVRGLTNVSTGETGIRLAEGLSASGAKVTLILSRNARTPSGSLQSLRRFATFEELESELEKALSNERFDACVHSAAVSDFKVARITTESGEAVDGSTKKLSSGEGLTLTLSPRHKLVSRIKALSKNPGIRLVSFKLSAKEGEPLEDVKSYAHSDFVVHNFAWEVERGSENHRARIFRHEVATAKKGSDPKTDEWTQVAEVRTKRELIEAVRGVIAL